MEQTYYLWVIVNFILLMHSNIVSKVLPLPRENKKYFLKMLALTKKADEFNILAFGIFYSDKIKTMLSKNLFC